MKNHFIHPAFQLLRNLSVCRTITDQKFSKNGKTAHNNDSRIKITSNPFFPPEADKFCGENPRNETPTGRRIQSESQSQAASNTDSRTNRGLHQHQWWSSEIIPAATNRETRILPPRCYIKRFDLEPTRSPLFSSH